MLVKRLLNKNIIVLFKYDVMPEINFMYKNKNLVRSPYEKRKKASSELYLF